MLIIFGTIQIWKRIEEGKLSGLNPFTLLTFADLKKCAFNYWFAFPVLAHATEAFHAIKKTPIGEVLSAEQLQKLTLKADAGRGLEPYFLLRVDASGLEISDIDSFDTFYDASNTFVVASAQGGADSLNWTMRNLLAALKCRERSIKTVKVIQYKCDRFNYQNIESSVVYEVDLMCGGEDKKWKREELQAVGWERNSKGALSGRMINLSSAMDQTKLAANAVDLNLKLMRWRLLPGLELEKIAATKCLLFGAGTLGCNVARNLMAWGVRHITFVDNGKVSFSNPVRQWLYTFEDSKNGAPKAQTAAERAKEVFPELTSRGVELTIPMPGHLVSGEEEKATAEHAIKTIEELIDEHDVAFLLLDSREARWLPTLIAESKGKPVITTALGFDNFVVMRHGVHHDHHGKSLHKMASHDLSTHGEQSEDDGKSETSKSHSSQPKTKHSINENVSLGCYFCNDVVAPQDSAKDRTLDQQCTVTRPGLSSMASSSAVELMVTLLHHPLKAQAPGDPKTDIGSDTATELGIVPHQVRGYLSFFSNLIITGHRYDKCVACSDAVVDAYLTRRNAFLFEAFNNPKHLEDITGITEMKQEQSELLDETWDTESDFEGLGEKGDLDDF